MLKHKFVRTASLFALCISVLGFGACKKTVNQVVNQNFSAIYKVQPNQWKAASGGGYYSYEMSVPELDQFGSDNGGVAVYISFDKNAPETYEATPEVYSGIAYGNYHSVGKVGIDMQAADGSQADITQAAAPLQQQIYVKVVLLDAQPLD